MNFTRLALGDIKRIKPFLEKATNRLCDNTVGGLFIWRDLFDSHYFISESGSLFLRHRVDGKLMFPLPFGNDRKDNIHAIERMCRDNGLPFIFCIVSSDELEILKEMYKNLDIRAERDWFDYLYDARSLTELSGKKYAGQRNHINRFKKLYPEYSFNMMDSANTGRVISFLEEFYERNDSEDPVVLEEKSKIFEVMDNFDIYGMTGGFISVSDRIVAIAIGEIIYDTLFVHIEKADTEFHGAYQMIVNEFARHICTPGTKYINREDDSGKEGLRTSKLSYHPLSLLEKYTVEVLP